MGGIPSPVATGPQTRGLPSYQSPPQGPTKGGLPTPITCDKAKHGVNIKTYTSSQQARLQSLRQVQLQNQLQHLRHAQLRCQQQNVHQAQIRAYNKSDSRAYGKQYRPRASERHVTSSARERHVTSNARERLVTDSKSRSGCMGVLAPTDGVLSRFSLPLWRSSALTGGAAVRDFVGSWSPPALSSACPFQGLLFLWCESGSPTTPHKDISNALKDGGAATANSRRSIASAMIRVCLVARSPDPRI